MYSVSTKLDFRNTEDRIKMEIEALNAIKQVWKVADGVIGQISDVVREVFRQPLTFGDKELASPREENPEMIITLIDPLPHLQLY